MVTNTASHVSSSRNEKKHLLITPKRTGLNVQGAAVNSNRIILKCLGILSTLLIGLVSVAPDAFGIPIELRPWVFLTAIFWFLVASAGLFNS